MSSRWLVLTALIVLLSLVNAQDDKQATGDKDTAMAPADDEQQAAPEDEIVYNPLFSEGNKPEDSSSVKDDKTSGDNFRQPLTESVHVTDGKLQLADSAAKDKVKDKDGNSNPQAEEQGQAVMNDAAAASSLPYEDPCEKLRCTGVGEECVIDDKTGGAECACVNSCASETDPRSQVCSNFNITFPSQCVLERQVCLCNQNLKGCDSPDFAMLQLDYMGHCKEFKPCSAFEIEEYPKRMRDWLFVIMKELANRKSLNKPAMMTLSAAERHQKKWLLPVIWKFCDLDISGDRQMTFDELLPISGPLKAYEHCTGPFINMCDTDRNKRISLAEWGLCLGLQSSEIVDMCATFRDA